jgi:hypothetical protein
MVQPVCLVVTAHPVPWVVPAQMVRRVPPVPWVRERPVLLVRWERGALLVPQVSHLRLQTSVPVQIPEVVAVEVLPAR